MAQRLRRGGARTTMRLGRIRSACERDFGLPPPRRSPRWRSGARARRWSERRVATSNRPAGGLSSSGSAEMLVAGSKPASNRWSSWRKILTHAAHSMLDFVPWGTRSASRTSFADSQRNVDQMWTKASTEAWSRRTGTKLMRITVRCNERSGSIRTSVLPIPDPD
jgi:hypothetical protein